jgi:hypothetical protein
MVHGKIDFKSYRSDGTPILHEFIGEIMCWKGPPCIILDRLKKPTKKVRMVDFWRQNSNDTHPELYRCIIFCCLRRCQFFRLLNVYRPPLWSSCQSFWLQIQRPRVRFPGATRFSEK